MIPRDFSYQFTYYEWQWYEPDPENFNRLPANYKNICRACGALVVQKWSQGHAKLHFARKELPDGMQPIFGQPT